MTVQEQIEQIDAQFRPLLNSAITDSVREGITMEEVTEMFHRVFTHHGEQFALRKRELGSSVREIAEVAEELHNDKDYQEYSNYEGLLLFLNDGLAIALYMIGIYEDALEAFKDALWLVLRPTLNSDASTEREVKGLVPKYTESVKRSKRWLAAIEKKQKGYERYANHIKDYFFNEMRGTVRTS